MITAPGVYDMPADDYHADPVQGGSLSSSGARKLLPPSCPALFRWERDNPTPSTKAMEAGTAAHTQLLGTGPEVVIIQADDWRTKDAREKAADARLAGQIPMLPKEYAPVEAMTEALRQDPLGGSLFQPGTGQAEASLVWHDDRFGIKRRARLDYLREPQSGRLLLVDYKTTVCASPREIPRTINAYGYHLTGAWYSDGILALGLAEDVAFLLVFQEKTPPYLVTVAQLDDISLKIGRERNAEAMHIYRECVETDTWPGYSDRVEIVSLPPWEINRYEQETAS